MIGAWPFHDHYRNIGMAINRGLFGGIVVLPDEAYEAMPHFPLPDRLVEWLLAAHDPNGPQPTGMTMGAAPAKPATAAPLREMPMAGMPMPGGGGGNRAATRWASACRVLFAIRSYRSTSSRTPPASPNPEAAKAAPRADFLAPDERCARYAGVRGAPLNPPTMGMPGDSFTSAPFTLAATYNYYCGIHGPSMSGSVVVQAGGPSLATVTIVDFQFNPPSTIVGIGGQVRWTNNGPSLHSVVESEATACRPSA